MQNLSRNSQARRFATVSLAAVSALALAACSSGGDDASSGGDGPAPVTVSAIMPLTADWPEMDAFLEEFIPALEEVAPWVTVDVVGSSEVVPADNQVESLSTGAYDMSPIYPSYSEGFIPGIAAAMLSPNSPTEEREAGTGDLYNEIFFEPHGLTYLGSHSGGAGFDTLLYLSDSACDAFDPENPSLSGNVIRGGPQYIEAVEYLGGSIVNMPVGEVYNALERGVIDGYGMTPYGLTAAGAEEITGCRILPEFKATFPVLTVNTAWWEGLEAETRDAIEEAVELSEPRMEEHYQALDAEGEEWLVENDIETIEMSPEAAEEFRDAVYSESWEKAIADNPEVERLREHWGN